MVRLTDRLNVTIAADLDIKTTNKTNSDGFPMYVDTNKYRIVHFVY